MISLIHRVRDLLAGVAGAVWYHYPASWAQLPCVSWRESGNRALSQADGREHLAELTYTIDIWAKSPEENAAIASEIDRRMAAARLRRTYCADIYETGARLHHRALRYRAVADAAGNIYQ
ncbi:MAG: tail completion protein gp17 [Christensenellales bacterium]|jgi:hypothetical protein